MDDDVDNEKWNSGITVFPTMMIQKNIEKHQRSRFPPKPFSYDKVRIFGTAVQHHTRLGGIFSLYDLFIFKSVFFAGLVFPDGSMFFTFTISAGGVIVDAKVRPGLNA